MDARLKIVEDTHFMAARKQCVGNVRANKACSPCYECFHGFTSSLALSCTQPLSSAVSRPLHFIRSANFSKLPSVNPPQGKKRRTVQLTCTLRQGLPVVPHRTDQSAC